MRFFKLERWWVFRAVLAAGAGLALAASFPKLGLAGLAWIAPGWMLLTAVGVSGGRAFRLGYLGGLAHALASLYWLLFIPFPAGAIAGWLALSAYLALYPAVWVWLCLRLSPAATVVVPTFGTRRDALRAAAGTDPSAKAPPHFGPRPPGEESLAGGGVKAWLQRFQSATWLQRTAWCVGCAALWVTLEMIAGRLFTGFPWNLLGVSQYQTLPLIQMASVTGVYGVSFMVAWGSVALACAGLTLSCRIFCPSGPAAATRSAGRLARVFRSPLPRSLLVSFRLTLFADLALPLVCLVVLMFSGAAKLVAPPGTAAPELRVALIQPSIPQRLIFDPSETTNRFNALMQLSELALAAQPDLLIWPEASLPGLEEAHYRAVTNMVAQHHVWMILGADDTERRPQASAPDDYDSFNSAFLFDPRGQYVATYRKRQLVIFGEYIPLESWLPLVKHLTPIPSSFASGKGPVTFKLTHPRANAAVLICFEDVFPQVARASVEPETDFLLNLTNNGWFGESAAQWQHAANAVFRAVENGRPLVRCTNNGLTCWVDSRGRLRDVGFGDRRDVYAAGFKTVRVPLLPEASKGGATFYHRYGDWFGWGCLGWVIVILATRGGFAAGRLTSLRPRHARPVGGRRSL